MKLKYFCIIMICVAVTACKHSRNIDHLYRVLSGQRQGYSIWIVDGNTVRQKIYKEFLYGGNDQRYIFTPKGEIWIDHAISCEEFEMTVAHELNERHLMAKLGWTYDRAHDSSLALEVVMRRRYQEICRQHEGALPNVSPTDWENKKEIRSLPDSITLNNIYRIPVGTRDGLSIWVVDGYLVRKNIFPDFGFSGNDACYHFIPKNEIWLDGQISCEEMEYSISGEITERTLMKSGKTYSDAYETAVGEIQKHREEMDKKVRSHPPYLIPDTLARDTGMIDPGEK
ncbi:MAG: hypothetical protein PHF97_07680 [Bacteroidales bacterium]|nr:hypothetical protein [Bacteroidales bacterium]